MVNRPPEGPGGLALLCPSPGPMPFLGHFRVGWREALSGYSVAGRIGAPADPAVAWASARGLEGAVRRCNAEGPAPAARLVRRVWEAVRRHPAGELGPRGGEDLIMLILAWDAEGASLSGVGLGRLWAGDDPGLRAVLPPEHPLLAIPPGRPAQLPGALSLRAAPSLVVGAPAGEEALIPAPGRVRASCGARR
jgi:hypothetical protein